MKNVYLKALQFIRENPSIIYSLILVAVIPAAFFLNTYLTTEDFEKDADLITQTYAFTIENVIKHVASQNLENQAALQESLNKIAGENEKITDLMIMVPHENREAFKIIAATNEELIGQNSSTIHDHLAWEEDKGIAFLGQDQNRRFWKVTKFFSSPDGPKSALISASFSLADTDKLISSSINRAYMILIITILVVVLLVSNQARLLGYALTLTKLKEIDKMKDTFIAMSSHELRAPLTAVKGYLEFLNDKQGKNIAADPDSQHYFENINLSINRLETLVSDILEVSRLEGNRIPIEIISFDPEPVISQSVEELRSQAVMKKIELKYSTGPKAKVKADKERLKQVVINLLGNAIKYTEKGSVTVSSRISVSEFMITVADTGIGISADEQANLFQKFYRVQNDQTKKIIGTGLGLWITHELVRRMNGKITVESIKGVGSHFTIHIPLAEL